MKADIKQKVKEHYGDIAKSINQGSNCGCGCDGINIETDLFYNQGNLNDLPKEAVLASLGCANPLTFAKLKEGEKVLDLGSGGGIDVLLASKYVGPSGKVYGLDMTDEMLALANKNKERMGADNVEFLKGYIEDIPIEKESIDVIMSNCVINLSENKEKALAETYRVLKKGGRIAIADIVTLKEVPKEINEIVQLWVGCIAGALKIDEYRRILEKVGFKDIKIEPVHYYTKSVIEEMMKRKDSITNINFDLALVDGAFAGAHVSAIK